jgi:acyl-CoA synthetase (AMP-forming)/AMP-acid ligase II
LNSEKLQGSAVGIFSINRPEWVIAMEACYAQSLITVPIYETLGRFIGFSFVLILIWVLGFIFLSAFFLTCFGGFFFCFCLINHNAKAEKAVVHILNEAEVKVIVCTADKVDKVRNSFGIFLSAPPPPLNASLNISLNTSNLNRFV